MNTFFYFFALPDIFHSINYLPRAFQIFSLKDLVDVAIVSVCVYLVLIFIKQTRSFFIVGSILVLFGVDFLARIFNLGLTRQLFQPLLTFFVAIFVLVFQPEIRKFFKWFASGRKMAFSKVLVPDDNVQTIVRASFEMAKRKIGAIIVLPGEYPLDDLVEGGFPLDGKISFPLILSIFDPTSPGHDGAVLVEGSLVKSFGLHLPLARDFSEFSRYGTRHRAASGITEKTDALAIVVSEERGEVSISLGGKITNVDAPEKLAELIYSFIKKEQPPETQHHFWSYFAKKNTSSKVISVCIAFCLWFFFIYQAGIIKQEYEIPIEFRYLPDKLTVSESVPTNVKIVLAGNNSDLNNFDTKSLRAFVDMKDAKPGEANISISKDNIKVPSYLDLTSVSPKNIKVTFKEGN